MPEGRIVAAYLVRITLHEDPEETIANWRGDPPTEDDPIPSLPALEEIVAGGLQAELGYFAKPDIGVSAERVDQ